MNVRRLHNLTFLLAALLAMAAGVSCVEPISHTDLETAEACELTLRIDLPSSEVLTKSEPVNPTAAENKFNDVRVWAFLHTGSYNADDEPVGFAKNPDTDGNLTMVFPNSVQKHLDNDLSVSLDVYVLVNASAVACTLDDMGITRGDIRAAGIDNARGGFGAGEYLVSSVPAEGLPMSTYNKVDITFLKYGLSGDQIQYIKSRDAKPLDEAVDKEHFSPAQWQYISQTLCPGGWDYSKVHPTIVVQRAVTKIRFVFAKFDRMIGDNILTRINSISLVNKDENNTESPVLLTETYLFPLEDGTFGKPAAATYTDCSWGQRVTPGLESEIPSITPLLSNNELNDNTIDNPMRLRKESKIVSEDQGLDARLRVAPCEMTTSMYEDFLTAEIALGNAVERVVYLRESDRPYIKARINYTMGSEHMGGFKTAEVDIDIPVDPDTQEPYNLYRNRLWTVYAYFSTLQQRLEVETLVLPWEGKVSETIHSLATVNVDQDGKFFVDPSVLGHGHIDTVRVDDETRYEVHVPSRPGSVKGRVAIYGPDGGYLVVKAVGDTKADSAAFEIKLKAWTGTGTDTLTTSASAGMLINRLRDGGRIYIDVARVATSTAEEAAALVGKKITLSFSVRMSADPTDPNARIMDADTEIIDEKFYFVIKDDPTNP